MLLSGHEVIVIKSSFYMDSMATYLDKQKQLFLCKYSLIVAESFNEIFARNRKTTRLVLLN